ncbi:MAG: hypothetical protein MK081_08935 [Flavobacteriales bacterium]|nr:hypothetical protein [Flavobacteriales bacterium]
MKRLFLMLCLFVGLTFSAEAQQAASDSTKQEESMAKRKVEGFWPVMGYLGGKLVDELSDRLNLEEQADSTQEPTKTEVEVKLGWIRFTRVDEE